VTGAAAAAVAGVITFSVPALAGATAVPAASQSSCRPNPVGVPAYDMALSGVIRHTLTGLYVTTVVPPKPFNAIGGVAGAADDRTFVLAAHTGGVAGRGPTKFFVARLDAATRTATLKPLAIPQVPAADVLTGLALSPDGTRLAMAVLAGPTSYLSVYSLSGRALRLWQAKGTIGFSVYDSTAISWSCGGTLAINWFAPNGTESASGIRLLRTSSPSGSLLAHSRTVISLGSVDGWSFSWDAMLTADGTKLVAPMSQQAGNGAVKLEFEEFSAATGKPLRVFDPIEGQPPAAFQALEWTNATGSVLIVGSWPPGGKEPVFGVLDHGFHRMARAWPVNQAVVVYAF
jgi:hypothetical protein